MKFLFIAFTLVINLVTAATSPSITLAQLDQAIPARASPGSCKTPECATNQRALVAINHAIQKYQITNRGEIVALVSLMAFESKQWEYNRNHFPGRPGQGTRAMLMPNYIKEYAGELHPSAILNEQTPDDVLKLVLNDDDSFGSAFWFYVKKGRNKLRNGNKMDFHDYVVKVVGAGWDPDRQTIWDSVNKAFLNI